MGRQKQWVVKLSDEERQQLTDMTRKGVHSARVMNRARLLLLSDQGLLDQDVAERQDVNAATVASIRRKYAEGGLQAALYEKARPKQLPKLDPQQTAILIAEVCSTPEGREKWTMQLLADRLVSLGVVDSISDETVRRTLKKTRSGTVASSKLVCRSGRRGLCLAHGSCLGHLCSAVRRLAASHLL